MDKTQSALKLMDKMQADLKLREEIRVAEKRVNDWGMPLLALPSEDAIMDNPGRYTARMNVFLGKLERLEQTLTKFNEDL